MQSCLHGRLVLPRRLCKTLQIAALKACAPISYRRRPTCGIPDYKSPVDYGIPKNLGATGGSAAGTGGLGSQTSPSGYESLMKI